MGWQNAENPKPERVSRLKAKNPVKRTGDIAEAEVKVALEYLNASINFSYTRLYDTRAIGQIVARYPSDFLACYKGRMFFIEVKASVRKKFNDPRQFPLLKKWAKSGANCVYLVKRDEHTWVSFFVQDWDATTEQSINLDLLPAYPEPRLALMDVVGWDEPHPKILLRDELWQSDAVSPNTAVSIPEKDYEPRIDTVFPSA
jgi:hypothetical protein